MRPTSRSPVPPGTVPRQDGRRTAATTGAAAAIGGRFAVRSLQVRSDPVSLAVVGAGPSALACLDQAELVIREVERSCSQADPSSPLSVANATPDRWHTVPASLAVTVETAAAAHRRTGGLFDPRCRADAGRLWSPRVVEDDGRWQMHLDGHAVDLGGVSQGIAVRRGAAELAGAGEGWMVDVGGDGCFAGAGPDGDGWQIGIDDAAGGMRPVLVLDTTDAACTTSATRIRRWRADGRPAHQVVDPRVGCLRGDGLRSVTVLAADAAWSEAWSRALLHAGARGIRQRAEAHGVAAAWLGPEGAVETTRLLDPRVVWRRPVSRSA
ncbi:FAD:protein FMN transferase [Cellulomonas sp. WB94]|uniref:FAD:protein FMN transferase n=1 Tax=Cellulomonas sp. WB94 TaxID=2173174 RepID=UPI001304FF56|nr:FAD:protein FMN transferase [Cellulomonas sp. WB94]